MEQINPKKQTLAIVAGMITAFALACVPICVRLSEVGPTATGFYRFFLSFPFLMTWMIFDHMKDQVPKTPRSARDYYLIWLAGAFLALDLIFWHWSMVHTSVVNAMLLSNLTPIFVALASWVFFHERLSVPLGVAIVLAVIGSMILVGGTFSLSASQGMGDLMAFFSCLFFSAFLTTIKTLTSKFRTPVIMAWGAVPTMYILVTTAYVSGEVMIPKSLFGWGVVFFLALFVHILGQGLLTFSMTHISATLSAMLMCLSPMFSGVLAWIFFKEGLSMSQLLGGIVVLGGVLIARLPQKRERITP
ncbi:MAG: DMT family transporter [Alphaproteobacteria bacterium]|nr:DMT family transporter [Alphaproteobacteria bacterium]